MSRNKNGSIRCDWCGKLSNSQDAYYRKPDGTAGYIHGPDWDREGTLDICEECSDKRCPYCASESIVHTHPTIPGPQGWGGRCKDCKKTWGMPTEVA